MNIYQAKKISLKAVLAQSGHRPVSIKKEGREVWYCSPFREEREPSFHIDTERNVWYDFGEGRGGDIIEFVKAYQNTDTSGALQWLEDKAAGTRIVAPNESTPGKESATNKTSLKLLSVGPIVSEALHRYLRERGIPNGIYEKYLGEVKFINTTTGKKYFALGFENHSKGYEIRNTYFKSTLGKKDITILEGQGGEGKLIHVFEGFTDFLTMLTMQKINAPKDDVIVLNSVSFCDRAKEFISTKDYKRIICWTDNDEGGRRAFSEFAALPLRVQFMGSFYEDYKDLNERHTAENV